MLRALIVLMIAALATGCRKAEEAKPPTTKTAAQTAAQKPEPAKVKLTLAFQPRDAADSATKESAEKLAGFIAEHTGYQVDVLIPKNYSESINALKKKKAQVVFLSGWAYLRAHMAADGDLLLVEERDGKTSFESNWYVAKNSKVKSLKDLRGKSIAFSTPTSASGFLYPYAKLIESGVVKPGEDLRKPFKSVFFAGDDGVLDAVLSGKVDAAAAPSFAPALYLPEADRAKVRVLSATGAVPTQGFVVRADIEPDVREKVKAALLALNEAGNIEMLKKAYGVQKLVARSHGDHVMGLQEVQETVGTEYPLRQKPEEAPAAPK